MARHSNASWSGEQLTRFLRRRGFSEYVTERAIDRVIHEALRYLPGKHLSRPPVRPLKNRVAWLFSSALKAARQEAMRQAVRTFRDHITLALEADMPDDCDLEAAVNSALDQLSEPQREAMYYCDMLGLTLKEAAARLGCLRTTVLRNRDRGRVRLRPLLAAIYNSRRVQRTCLL